MSWSFVWLAVTEWQGLHHCCTHSFEFDFSYSLKGHSRKNAQWGFWIPLVFTPLSVNILSVFMRLHRNLISKKTFIFQYANCSFSKLCSSSYLSMNGFHPLRFSGVLVNLSNGVMETYLGNLFLNLAAKLYCCMLMI